MGEVHGTWLGLLVPRCALVFSDSNARTDGLWIAGLQDQSDATIETLKAIEHPVSKQAQILVDTGTGNVLRVEAMLHHCDEHVEKEKEKEKEENKDDKEEKKDEPKVDDTFQTLAVLGIALIAMGTCSAVAHGCCSYLARTSNLATG